jgi:hypothetical protein
MPRILKMYAWIVSDSGPDDEGVVAWMDPTTGEWGPLIGADRTRIEGWRKRAQATANKAGKQVRLIEFDGPPRVIAACEPDPSSATLEELILTTRGQTGTDAMLAHAEKIVFPTDAHVCKPCLNGSHVHQVCSMIGCRCTAGKV